MLMLTHTRLLKMFLSSYPEKDIGLDAFIHNVSPDLLPVHEGITSDMTHKMDVSRTYREDHKYAAFVRFHLLVDDIAHHGRIYRDASGFDPDSQGYAYRKGKPLIEPIMDFHSSIGLPINYSEAAYRSHIIVEMAFDQAIQDGESDYDLDSLLLDALDYTVTDKMDDFCSTSSWLYRIPEKTIAEAIKEGREKCIRDDKAELFASSAGRIALYINKFGLDSQNDAAWSGLRNLLRQGEGLVDNYEEFLTSTIRSIGEACFDGSL